MLAWSPMQTAALGRRLVHTYEYSNPIRHSGCVAAVRRSRLTMKAMCLWSRIFFFHPSTFFMKFSSKMLVLINESIKKIHKGQLLLR